MRTNFLTDTVYTKKTCLTLCIPARRLCRVQSCSWPPPDSWTQCYLSAGAFHHHTFLWTLPDPAGGQCSPVPLRSQRSTDRSEMISHIEIFVWFWWQDFIWLRTFPNLFVTCRQHKHWILHSCIVLTSGADVTPLPRKLYFIPKEYYTLYLKYNFLYILGRLTLTRNVNWPWDKAVLSEFPGLSDIYNYRFLASQELLQLVISHIWARWSWTEPAEQQHCSWKQNKQQYINIYKQFQNMIVSHKRTSWHLHGQRIS